MYKKFFASSKVDFSFMYLSDVCDRQGQRTKRSFVKLVIYNSLGEEATKLVNEEMSAGNYQADWNAIEYPSGVYFYRLQTDGYTEVKRMISTK